jgi:hypothetical protein
MHDTGCPVTELCFTLPILGTRSAGPEPPTEGGIPGCLEAEAADAGGMSATPGGAGSADVLRGADARVVALAPLVPASTGAALTSAPAVLPDMAALEVRGRPFRQSNAGRQSAKGAGGKQPQHEAAGPQPMQGTSEVVQAISVHTRLQCDEVRTDEDVPISLALRKVTERRQLARAERLGVV